MSYRQARPTPEECRRRARGSHIPEAYLQVRHRPTPSSLLDLRDDRMSRSWVARCDTHVQSDSCTRDIHVYILVRSSEVQEMSVHIFDRVALGFPVHPVLLRLRARARV